MFQGGEYSPTETYDFLQFVYYKDSTYVAKKETTGNTPAENNEFWQLLAKGQVTGVSGVKGDKETNYRTGNVNITAENVGALPLTGGTIEGNAFVPLYVKNSSSSGVGSGAGIVLANDDGNLLNIQGIQKSDGDSYLRIFDFRKSPFTCLLEVSNASKKVFDHKTNGLKEILVDGDVASLLKLLRTTSNANYKPGINVFDAKEFSNSSENIPTQDFYHIITMQGQDIREEYVTQLAVGMTKDAMYYRRMDHDAWGEWKKIFFNGDVLQSDGATILGDKAPMLEIKKTAGNYSAIGFARTEDDLIRLQCFLGNETEQPRFEIVDFTAGLNSGRSLLTASKTQGVKAFDVEKGYIRNVAFYDDTRYAAGETFSIPTNTPLAGILTTSAKEIYFTIPLPKNVGDRKVSVACTGLRVRGNAGYIIENKDISEYKVTTTVIENLLKVLIVNPSGEAFYNTNNIAVTVAGIFTITFS